jgi:hypothetical protein
MPARESMAGTPAAAWPGGAVQGLAAAHVEPDLGAGGDVGPGQRGQAAFVLRRQLSCPVVAGEDVLDHEGVDVYQGGLRSTPIFRSARVQFGYGFGCQ